MSISVVDVNDNPPVFIIPAIIGVLENTSVGTPVYHIVAKDIDSGKNAQVSYRLVAGPGLDTATFSIGMMDGVLTLQLAIDREKSHSFNIKVMAFDAGTPQLSSTLAITVNVIDLNDNSPIFTPLPASYAITVAENELTGKVLQTLLATDADTGLNGVVRYIVTAGDNAVTFYLDSFTGELSLRWSLDYEYRSSYNLTIVAHDLGQPQLSSTAFVTVTVIDGHDFAPSFLESPFIAFVYEGVVNLPVYVTQLSVRYDTSPAYSRLTYSLSNSDTDNGQNFNINSTSGVVTSISTLNREVTPQYTFAVVTLDSGLSPYLSL